jgi:hypothetical protein
MPVPTTSKSWLMRDIGLVLTLKAAALALIYVAFFAHPAARMLTPDLVARHIAVPAPGREVP